MLVSEGFLPMESFKLGCFLVDINNPHVSRRDPAVQLDPNDVLISPQINYSEVQHTGSKNSFAASLTNLLSLSCSKTLDTSTTVTSEQVTTYKLANSGAWFRKALKDKDTRVWIEEQKHDGYDDLFVVVGYHTMSNAIIVLGADDAQDISGQVQVPVSEAMTAGGVVLPVGGILDPKISAQHGESRRAKLRFTAPGERICALQYRKVVYKWFSSRDLDSATLDKDNVWKSLKTLRSTRTKKDKTDVDVDDVLEVDLADETESKEGKEIYRVLGDEGEFFLE
jgi:hypothetical protein